MSTSRADHPPNLVWDWSVAAFGALYALPAAVVALSDTQRGIALAVGVLPGAIAGLLPRRRGRLAIVALGAAIGVPMFLGGLPAGAPGLAVVAIAALGVGAAALAARFRLGTIAMTLCLPMFGVGLSYSDVGKATGLAGLMILGSVFACVVSMLWPERPPPARRSPQPPGAKPTLGYGLTGFLVFLMLLYSDPQAATRRFNERVLETLLGVGIAYFYGLALPALARQRRD